MNEIQIYASVLYHIGTILLFHQEGEQKTNKQTNKQTKTEKQKENKTKQKNEKPPLPPKKREKKRKSKQQKKKQNKTEYYLLPDSDNLQFNQMTYNPCSLQLTYSPSLLPNFYMHLMTLE